jgi:hypothetical protein
MFNVPSFFGFKGSISGGGIPLLLDTYSGAAAGYSLRGLSTPYVNGANPYACQVRNSSNVALNIGFIFNSLTGDYELDTAALLAHCGGGNGFVDVWYDQSGNVRNATQVFALNQPQIVSSGSVILENGKPAAQFDGTDDFMTATGFGTGEERSVFLTMRGNGNGSGYENYYIFIESFPSTLGNFMQNFSTDYTSVINANFPINTLDIFTSNAVDTQLLLTTIKTTSTSELFKNSTSLGTGSGTQNLESDLSIGNFSINFAFFKMQEMVVYNSDESSNRTGIEDNINDFYSIYP